MSKPHNLTGVRFNRLTVVKRVANHRNGHARWECVCECGATVELRATALRSGKTTSCGCYQRDRRIKHGYSEHALCQTWFAMNDRCYNRQRHNYCGYGGRGISVAPEWRKAAGPKAFCDWVDANLGPRPEGMSLDRIDNDGNYEPGNLRWATKKQQTENQRKKQSLTHAETEWLRMLREPIEFIYQEAS